MSRIIFNKHNLSKNQFMLTGPFKRKGYDWWWHSFTAINEETKEETPFFIEFFLCNPALKEKEPVLGQSEENKKNKKRPSYLMIKVGCWGKNKVQLHRFISWDDVKIHKGAPYSIEALDCFASENKLKGKVEVSKEESENKPEMMCDYGSIEFDLEIDKQIAYNVGYGTSWLFRFLKAFEMYWHAEGIKSKYKGHLIMNGVKYIVEPDSSYGYADKNWGRGFTSPWVWLSSNNMKSNLTEKVLSNSAFDIGGGRPKIFFIALNRKLLGCMYYEGQEFEFNFSKFWTKPKTKFSYEESDKEIIWYIRQENRHAVMDTNIRCNKQDMLLVNYEAPDGSKRHNNLWNGGNGVGNIKLYRKKKKELELIDDIEVSHVGCEYGEYDK